MKKQFIAIAAMVALLCSCGQKKSETAVDETIDETTVMEAVDPASDTLAESAEAEAEPSSSQSTNWDALLDEYEDYMTQAVKMAKKHRAVT